VPPKDPNAQASIYCCSQRSPRTRVLNAVSSLCRDAGAKCMKARPRTLPGLAASSQSSSQHVCDCLPVTDLSEPLHDPHRNKWTPGNMHRACRGRMGDMWTVVRGMGVCWLEGWSRLWLGARTGVLVKCKRGPAVTFPILSILSGTAPRLDDLLDADIRCPHLPRYLTTETPANHGVRAVMLCATCLAS